MNLKLSPRDQLIIGIVAVLLIAVLFVVFLIQPKYAEMGDVQAKQGIIRRDVAANQATLARLKDAQRESIANRAELIRIANQIPDQPEIPTLIVEVQDLANQAGIDFISITPKEPANVGPYSSILLDLQTKGQFRDLMDFLSRLSSLQRKVRVNTVNIAVQEYPDLSMQLTGETFVMAPIVATTTAPPPPPTGGGG